MEISEKVLTLFFTEQAKDFSHICNCLLLYSRNLTIWRLFYVFLIGLCLAFNIDPHEAVLRKSNEKLRILVGRDFRIRKVLCFFLKMTLKLNNLKLVQRMCISCFWAGTIRKKTFYTNLQLSIKNNSKETSFKVKILKWKWSSNDGNFFVKLLVLVLDSPKTTLFKHWN